jgi:hypothetical protein
MKLRGGFTNYGETIGILMLDTCLPASVRATSAMRTPMTFPWATTDVTPRGVETAPCRISWSLTALHKYAQSKMS